MGFPPLTSGRADLWYAFEADVEPVRLAAFRSILSPEESAQLQRLVFEHSRSEYLLGRALCRTTLSRYSDTAPEKWSFLPNAHGRPEIARPKDSPPLRFNLTHTRGLAACLVTMERDVGVDAEDLTHPRDIEEIADGF